MSTVVGLEKEHVAAVHLLDHELRRAHEMVDELYDGIRSALRVLDDAELDGAKARLSDRGEHYLEVASEHMTRLQNRCRDIGEVTSELTGHLTAAAAAVHDVEILSAQLNVQGDPHAAAGMATLAPRTAILREMVDLARPVAEDLAQHVASAEHSSRHVTAEGMLSVSRLERGVQTTGIELGRADEDIRLLDRVVERATNASREARGLAEEISDTATRRMNQHQAATGSSVPVPAPRESAVGR